MYRLTVGNRRESKVSLARPLADRRRIALACKVAF